MWSPDLAPLRCHCPRRRRPRGGTPICVRRSRSSTLTPSVPVRLGPTPSGQNDLQMSGDDDQQGRSRLSRASPPSLQRCDHGHFHFTLDVAAASSRCPGTGKPHCGQPCRCRLNGPRTRRGGCMRRVARSRTPWLHHGLPRASCIATRQRGTSVQQDMLRKDDA